MSSGNGARIRPDLGRFFEDLAGKDIADSMIGAQPAPKPAAAQVVHATTENGHIINLGSMPPEALAELLRGRKRSPRGESAQ